MMASTASKALRVLVPGLLLSALMAHAGGWAVITVDDLPDYVEAAKPVTLSFIVRQHGVTLLDQLTPSIRATSGRLTANGTVRSAAAPGTTPPRSPSPARATGRSRSRADSARAT